MHVYIRCREVEWEKRVIFVPPNSLVKELCATTGDNFYSDTGLACMGTQAFEVHQFPRCNENVTMIVLTSLQLSLPVPRLQTKF